MTQIIKYFCDICQIECTPQKGLATFAGFLMKLNEKLEMEKVGFEGHYCPEDTEKILLFISEIKNAKHNDTK